MAAPELRPRLRVAAVLPRQGGIVLVRHEKDGVAYHLLPGGGVEVGETIETALRREVLEETGLDSRLVAPLFVSDSIDPDGDRHMVQLTFLAAVTGGDLAGTPADAAVVGVEIVDARGLDALDLRPPMADALLNASRDAFNVPARYLGALWADDDRPANTAHPSASD